MSNRVHPFSDRIFFLLVDTWSEWFDRIEHLLPDPENVNPIFQVEELQGQFFVFTLDGALSGVGATVDDAARDAADKLHLRLQMGNATIDSTLN